MKALIKSKLVLTLITMILLAGAIVIPLSGSITHSHAASRSSHNIAYVNYDDSGFTESDIPSANIFSDAVVGGPSPTSSSTDSVTYNGMTFTPLTKASLSTSTLAPYDTLILFEVCDIATSLSSSQHDAINTYLAAGNKIILFDGDRCAPGSGGAGNADYSWFTFPFTTSNPGPQGASGTLTVVENSSLTQGLASDPFNSDELGDANTATTSDPHWFAAAKTTNVLGNNGYFLAYARNTGLIIYDGADHWFTDGPTKSLTDLFLNELNQQYDPDNLPSSTPIAHHNQLFILLQGIGTSLSSTEISNGETPSFTKIRDSLKKQFPSANFMSYSYNGIDKNGQLQQYGCAAPFLRSIKSDVANLDDEITSYLNQHPNQNTDIYLIGHSLGGVVALGYLAFLESKGWPALPEGGSVRAVITLDSPIGGVAPSIRYDLAIRLVATKCNTLLLGLPPYRSVRDLKAIFSTAQASVPLGGQASIAQVLFRNNTSNQQLANDAKTHGVSVLTIGNLHDFLWDTSVCTHVGLLSVFLPRVNILSTQWLKDEGSNSAEYGRSFTADASGSPNCTKSTILNDGLNHFLVLSDPTVLQGITEFLPNGGTPSSLAVAPDNPPGI
jgi:pimeloyl-ACP methyl ester carboxylesterase